MTFPDPGFTTTAMAAIFAADRRVAGLLSFEVNLARAEAELGLTSPEIAEEIAAACQGFDGDPEAIIASGWERGTPLLGLLEAIRSGLSPEANRTLHRGATSQDAIDTALMLQIRDAISLLGARSGEVANKLALLARNHANTPYMARTLLQEALPTTFGQRASHWEAAVVRANNVLGILGPSLPLQLGGPIGEVASLGERSQELTEKVAARLGLAVASLPWHTDRSYVRRPIGATVEIALAMEKVAFDLALLTGFGEVTMRPGGSSSMDHKRNPIDAIRAVAAARACVAAASALTAVGGNELERGIGAWQVEWWAVPLVFQAASAAVAGVDACLADLEVRG